MREARNIGRPAEQLAWSPDRELDPDAEDAWSAEIERRLARIDTGTSTTVTMSEAIARLHRAARTSVRGR